MNGSLNIIRSGDLHDFEKLGYFRNTVTGVPLAPDGKLIPFFYPFSETGSGYTVSSFKLIEVDQYLNAINTYTLTSSYCRIYQTGDVWYFTYLADVKILGDLTSYNDGLHRFYILLSTGQEFYTEIFKIDQSKAIEQIGVGDFDRSMFNNDFSRNAP